MAHSKYSVVIVEEDSHVSRVLRNHFEAAIDGLRVEIAGSAAKARMICTKFPPTFIIWDGTPSHSGTEAEYAACIPPEQWKRVIPISNDQEQLKQARERGCLEPSPKRSEALNSWSEELVARVKSLMPKGRK